MPANYVICGSWTGWHPNEASALKWNWADFRQGKIMIREGRVLRPVSTPKSTGSLRYIDILPPVQEELQNQKPLSYLVGDYVFLDAKQRPIDQELFRQKA